MRKIRKTFMILFVMVCALFACSAVLYASEGDAAGRYDATECVKDGSSYQCDGEYILLNQDGSGEIQFNGSVYALTWEMDDESLSITDEDGETESGTLEDGVIRITYLDYQYIYTKNDTSLGGSIDASGEAPAAAADEEKDADKEPDQEEGIPESSFSQSQTVQGGPAVYVVTDRQENGSSDGEQEGHPAWRKDYIALNEDGTGIFLFNNSAFTIRWEQDGTGFSFTDHLGRDFRGTADSGIITGEYGRYRYTFEEKGLTLPSYTLMPENWGQDLPPVVDEADVLNDTQEEEFIRRATELADQYDVGVYVVLVEDQDNYTWSGNISTLSEELRSGYSIGIGPTEKKAKHEKNQEHGWKDSILLTIAVRQRKYDLCASGDYANWAFSTYAREKIRDEFLDNLKGNDWAGAVRDYLDNTSAVLKVTSKGKQYSFKNDTTGRLVGILVPAVLALLFGYGIAAVKRSSMQNTQKAKSAAEYIASDRMDFTRREDRYIRTLVSRTYSPREKSSSGGGGGSFTSSSGSSHTSGSF